MKKIITKYTALALLMLYLSFMQRAFAFNAATPEVSILDFPEIIINEVSLKDSDGDWIELFVIDDNNEGEGNLIKGMQLKDDSNFIEITSDLEVRTNDYIIVTFKKEQESVSKHGNLITIDITRAGLTGTTEQVILLNSSNEIIDAVCWTSDSPTQSEIDDFNEIVNQNQWHDQSISSCFQSESIENGNSIGRIDLKDTNSSNDFIIFTETSRGDPNLMVEEEQNQPTDLPEVQPDPETDNNVKPENTATTKEDICTDKILINEIMPNPEGRDTGNEWIELINNNEELCSLEGWVIDDEEGGSSPYILDQIINGSGFLLLPSWQTKINLNNGNDTVRLFTPTNTLTEEIEYFEADEQNSYSRFEDEIFEWSKAITPLLPNKSNPEVQKEKSEKTIEKNKENKIQNGTLSNQIIISEIFPNPEGKDKGSEWVEIFNDSNEGVNLGNWTIDTGEDGKSHKIENIKLEAGSYMILSDEQLGFSLKNSGGLIRIKDYTDTVISTLHYDEAMENQSYMWIDLSIYDEFDNYEWSKSPTPGEKNKTYSIFEGEIIDFDIETGELILNEEKQELIIQVVSDGDSLIMQTLKVGMIIKAYVSHLETGAYLLERHEIIKEPLVEEDTEQDLLYLILSSLPPLGFFGYLGLKKLF